MPALSPMNLLRALALCAASTLASAQTSSIYACTDAQGRRLTSDRPIVECLDREQREISRTGTLRRVIPPTPTAAEREAKAARERDADAERQREREALRRDEAMVVRYPDSAALEYDRKDALAQSQSVVDMAERRIAELTEARQKLDQEMEFYSKDPNKAPLKLRRSIESNDQEMQTQRQAIANQEGERKRINATFDERAKRLQPLWQAKAGGAK